MEQTTTRSFVRTYLPWLAAAGMLLLYIITLNREVSFASVLPVAKGTGLDWHPTFIAPFTWLVTLPARWLPSSAQLVGLNLIGALCAAATIWLLARSVALLPHDRTHDQRIREQDDHGLLSIPTAWVAPLFAAVLFGVQRTFWENAIVCTGETVDTLLVAYVIRCLLEFRRDGRNGWLWKLALVYGIGIANNHAFIAFAPFMLVALVWLKKLKFFEFSFLARLALYGLAGLSLYLLLPIVQTMNTSADTSFVNALRVNLGYQKSILFGFPRWRAFWLGGYPLLLMMLIAIRWPSGWGDISKIGGMVGTAIAHLLHAALLALTIWMAFDQPASPRQLGLGLSFLTSYFLGALAAGYFVGYLLLVFSDFSMRKRRGASIMVPLSYLVTVLVCTVALVVPLKLAMDNWSGIAAYNAKDFRDLARQQLASLPKQPAVVMSDDLARLYGIALVGGREAGHAFIETRSLDEPGYHRYLEKALPGLMPAATPETRMKPVPGLANLATLDSWKQKRELFYLQPSFGYFFERFFLQPQQAVYRLETYPTNSVEAPVVSPAVIAQQAEYWNRLSTTVLKPIEARVAKLTPARMGTEVDLMYAARAYSQALDWWAVELQRAGKFEDAAAYLDHAVALNPNNTAAFITREANAEWRKNHKRLDRLSEQAMSKLQQERGGVQGVLNVNGPIDEPTFQTEIMQVFAQAGLWRQAAQHVLRALAFAPDEVAYQLPLANVYLGWGKPDAALAIINQIRSKHSTQTLAPAGAVEIARTEAAAYFAKDDFASAEKALKTAQRLYPELDAPYLGLSQLYVSRSDALKRTGNTAAANQAISNALEVTQQQIRQQPQNSAAYFNQGNIYMYIGDYERAIVAFTHVLDVDPKNMAARLNRAIANLQAKKYSAAQADYEQLLAFTTTSFQVYYGLGEVAYQKKDWRTARDCYEKYLRYAPQSEEAKFIKNRLAEVKKKA